MAGLDMDRDLDGYIEKPFAPQELLEVTEATLRKRGKLIGAAIEDEVLEHPAPAGL